MTQRTQAPIYRVSEALKLLPVPFTRNQFYYALNQDPSLATRVAGIWMLSRQQLAKLKRLAGAAATAPTGD